MGFARASEGVIREMKGLAPGSKLGTEDKVIASTIGGVLGCWNHPIGAKCFDFLQTLVTDACSAHGTEVVRVEMQSLIKSGNRPVKPTIVSTFRYIYSGRLPPVPTLFHYWAHNGSQRTASAVFSVA